MAIALSPSLDYVIVRKTEEQAPSGLYLAAPVDPTAPRHAEVLAVGGGRPSEYSGAMILYNGEPSPVRVGDTIVMHGGAGTKLKLAGGEVWAVLPRDIIGVVTPDYSALREKGEALAAKIEAGNVLSAEALTT